MPTLRATTLIGCPVTCPDGMGLGHVDGLVPDPPGTTVSLVQIAGHEALILPFEAVYELSERALGVTHADDPVPPGTLPQAADQIERHTSFEQVDVLLDDGAVRARIRDLHFDVDTGEVESFKLASQDSTIERSVTIPPQVLRWNGKTALLNREGSELLKDQLFESSREAGG